MNAQDVVKEYLRVAPEQGDWPLEDHLDGLASGILNALVEDGHRVVRSGNCGQHRVAGAQHDCGCITVRFVDEWTP